jgi:hypothetical protein
LLAVVFSAGGDAASVPETRSSPSSVAVAPTPERTPQLRESSIFLDNRERRRASMWVATLVTSAAHLDPVHLDNSADAMVVTRSRVLINAQIAAPLFIGPATSVVQKTAIDGVVL